MINFYHRSPRENRQSIEQHGLIASTKYEDYWKWNGYDKNHIIRPVVFLYEIPGRSYNLRNSDLWKIDLTKLDFSLLVKDPATINCKGWNWYMYCGSINPEALIRVKTIK